MIKFVQDSYFMLGAESILTSDELKPFNVCFYQFRKQDIKAILEFFPIFIKQGKQVIIISDSSMMPLASFYFKLYDNVVGVISNKMQVDLIRALTLEIVSNIEKQRVFPNTTTSLTCREHAMLYMYFKKGSVNEIAKSTNLKSKTIYSRILVIKKKMKVSKLTNLLV